MERKELIRNVAAAILVSLSALPAHADQSFSERFLQLLNERRAEYGLASLPRSEVLEMIAEHRTWQLNAGGEFVHRDEDGNFKISPLFLLYGENTHPTRAEILGWGYPAGRQTPETMMGGFMNSCEHIGYILWEGAEEVGIATAITNDGKRILVGVLTGNSSPERDCS